MMSTAIAILRSSVWAFRRVSTRAMRAALWLLVHPVPQLDRLGLYLPAIATVCCYGWWKLYPVYPGHAIAALALVALIMTVRSDKFPIAERVIWVSIGATLMFTEVRVLYIDRVKSDAEQKRERSEQQARFEETIKRFGLVLDENRKHFDKTIGRIDDVINTETGGDTFCYLAFDYEPTWEIGGPIPVGYFSLNVVRVGRYPLRDVSISLSDNVKYVSVMNELSKRDKRNPLADGDEGWWEIAKREMTEAEQASTQTFRVRDFAARTKSLGKYPLNNSNTQEFQVLFSSFNIETFIERVKLVQENDHWSEALIVELPRKKEQFWTKIDRDFPRKNGHLDVNWPRLAKGRDKWDH